jgi:general secretion pathway protein I
MNNGRPNAAMGFSLVEVLVAFSILALSLGVLLALFSSGLRNTGVAYEYSRAVILAESKLAEPGVTEPLEIGTRQGSFDGQYRWRTEVAEYLLKDEPIQASVPLRAYQVTVRVSWSGVLGDRSVALSTLRLTGTQ